jgi:hypothetical protein
MNTQLSDQRQMKTNAPVTYSAVGCRALVQLLFVVAISSCAQTSPIQPRPCQSGAEIGQRVIIHYPYWGDEIGVVTGTRIDENGDTIWEVRLPDGTIEPIWSFGGWGTTILPNSKMQQPRQETPTP